MSGPESRPVPAPVRVPAGTTASAAVREAGLPPRGPGPIGGVRDLSDGADGALRDLAWVPEVDVEVEHTFALLGDRAERAMHARAAAAHLGAELQQGGTVAQRLGTQPLRLDDLARVEVTGAVLLPPRADAHADRHREERGEDEDGIDQSHSLRV